MLNSCVCVCVCVVCVCVCVCGVCVCVCVCSSRSRSLERAVRRRVACRPSMWSEGSKARLSNLAVQIVAAVIVAHFVGCSPSVSFRQSLLHRSFDSLRVACCVLPACSCFTEFPGEQVERAEQGRSGGAGGSAGEGRAGRRPKGAGGQAEAEDRAVEDGPDAGKRASIRFFSFCCLRALWSLLACARSCVFGDRLTFVRFAQSGDAAGNANFLPVADNWRNKLLQKKLKETTGGGGGGASSKGGAERRF
jgi:hypothetical protein